MLRARPVLQALPSHRPFVECAGSLGEPLWRPPAPNGYADTEAAWIDGVPRRLDIANRVRRPAAAKD